MKKTAIETELRKYINPQKAAFFPRFFKSGPGEYGEGDKFLGVSVPQVNLVANQFKNATLIDINEILRSEYHELRLLGLTILVIQFKKAYKSGDSELQKRLYDYYLQNTKYVNNWDLVDSSAYKIVGRYLLDKDRSILYTLAKSKLLWEQRISIISTMEFIRNNDFADTLKISEILVNHSHDLIHKAVGWMLREVAKKDKKPVEKFLSKYSKVMPRTMLRYTLEKFPDNERKFWMGK